MKFRSPLMPFFFNMKVFTAVRMLMPLVVGLIFTCPQAGAQNLVLSVTTSTNTVVVSNSVTYTINLTNQTGVLLQNVSVTNVPSAPVLLLSATNLQGSIFTNAAVVVFNLVQLVGGGFAQMTMTVAPTTVGILTNTVSVGTFISTNIITTNVVIQVTAAQADLAVGIAGPAAPVFVNDWFIYGTAVTNRGPATAQNVILSNTLPAGVGVISVSPTNPAYALTNGILTFNLGTLTNGAVRAFSLRVQATNSGSLNFSASVSGAGILDTNTSNNTASTNIVISNFSGQLIATNASAMAYNPQTGLMEQTVNLANIGTNSVASARVIVSGLTNRLYNSVGTNNGNPFVLYGTTLDTNQSVNLVLEYFVPARLPITVPNSNYTAVGVSAADLSAVPGTNGTFMITLMTNLPSGNRLIEFQSILGRSYTIQYSGDAVNFTNAQPSIIAPADRVQWIDDGPPKTISPPASAPSRFYRVLLNP
jgi:uncharacterized repeat protein (TIGR01451 family)